MRTKIIGVLVCLVVLICAAGAVAQSVDCNSPTSVAPDGRTLSGSIPAVTTFWFSVAARGTSSYAAEANYPTAADSAFPALNAFAPTDVQPGCSGTSTLSPRNIMQFDPVIPNGNRVSITAASAMTILVSVTNSTMQARDFTVRVAETTLFNPLWSTFGGFETFYRLQNTTRDSITVTLRLINDAGTTVATHNQMLAANSTAPTIFTGPGPAPGLGVTDNQAGQAILTHDGPPGALQVDGFLGLFTATPVVLPIKIVPAREGVSVSRTGAGGDITAVNTMMMGGLEGGATAGDVNLSLLTSCQNGQILKWTGTMWSCQDDSVGDGGGGDITAVNTPLAGGLEGGSVSGDANLSLNTKCATGEILLWNGSAWVCSPTAPTDAQGNVGIGTSPDPNAQLTVENMGTVATDNSGLVVNNLTNNFGSDGTRKTGVKVRSMGSFPGGVGTFTTNTGLDVDVAGADLNQAATFMGGPVGIGTTDPDPSFMLEVVGDVRINSKFDLGTDACSSLSLSGRGRLCFNGTEFLVSEDGGAYQELVTAKDTVSGSTSDQILNVIQTGPGVVNPDFNNIPPSAIRGEATTNTNTAVGVLGVASGPDSVGVLGANTSLTGETHGVIAVVRSADGAGLDASNEATSGFAKGLIAEVHSPDGTAAWLENTAGGRLIIGLTTGNQEVFRVDGNGTVTATAFVGDGSGLTNLPGGGGGVSSITAGNGLTATPSNPIMTSGTLAVDFAGPGAANTVARSDHNHEAAPLGQGNTGVGPGALAVNAGTNNTAMGFNALQANTSGINNTAVGINALTANTFGNNNAAVGSFALSANTGGLGNTALGRSALAANLTGNNNAAVGLQALLNNTGSNNVAIGSQAGLSATTGNNNIYIGHFGVAAEGNTIRIGTSGTQAATFMAGITGVSVTGSAVMVDGNGQLGVTVSTQRAKEDIRDMGEASEGLLRLRPVVFRYRQPAADGTKPLQYGLIAEEVAEVMPELVVYDAEGQPQTVQYHVLPALLVNELQRQQAKLQQQQGELAELRARLEKQDAELAELKAALRTTLAQRQP